MRIVLRAFVILFTLLISFVIWRSAVLTSSGQLMWFVSDSHSITSMNGKTEEAYPMQSFHRPIKILDTFGAAKGGLHLGFRSFRILFTGRTSHSIATATLSVLFHHKGRFDREVQFGDHSVAFAADDGSHLAVRWQ
jgi:hypothetical protein